VQLWKLYGCCDGKREAGGWRKKRRNNTNVIFEICPKNSVTNLITKNYRVVENFYKFYYRLSGLIGNLWKHFINFRVVF